jgi:predicted transposase/invertase (TIGR01784 family)
MHTKEELKLTEERKAFYETDSIGDIYPEYYLLEVKKFDETIRSKFDEWIYFLKTDEVKNEFTAKGLAEAKEKLDYLKLSLEEQAEYDQRMNNRSSFTSAMDTAKMEGELIGEARGVEKGKAEGELIGEARGIEKGILQTAKKMKSEGIGIDIISKVTGLPAKELAGL